MRIKNTIQQWVIATLFIGASATMAPKVLAADFITVHNPAGVFEGVKYAGISVLQKQNGVITFTISHWDQNHYNNFLGKTYNMNGNAAENFVPDAAHCSIQGSTVTCTNIPLSTVQAAPSAASHVSPGYQMFQNNIAKVTVDELQNYMISQGLTLEEKDDNGYTPLIRAAGAGRADLVGFLLVNKANVNAQGNDGMTALMWAANHGYDQVIKVLLGNKADKNLKNKKNQTAHDIASQSTYGGHEVIAGLFVNEVDVWNKRVKYLEEHHIQIPEDLECPLSMNIIRDPVHIKLKGEKKQADGSMKVEDFYSKTYEREEIIKALKRKPVDPFSTLPVTVPGNLEAPNTLLEPDMDMKTKIQKFMDEHAPLSAIK